MSSMQRTMRRAYARKNGTLVSIPKTQTRSFKEVLLSAWNFKKKLKAMKENKL